jgi:cytochrome oxidase assembly protein ShyY1
MLFHTRQATSRLLTSFKFQSNKFQSRTSNSNPTSSTSSTSSFGIILFSSLTLSTFGLGVWQSYRYGWKLRVLEQRAKHLAADPIDVTSGFGAELLRSFDGLVPSTLGDGEEQQGKESSYPSSSSSSSSSVSSNSILNELQQVKVRGRFVNDKIAFIGPRPPPQDLPSSLSSVASNSGALVVRALEREGDNGRILVLEGWSPREQLDKIETNMNSISSSSSSTSSSSSSSSSSSISVESTVNELKGVVRRGERIKSFISSLSSSSSSSSSSATSTVPTIASSSTTISSNPITGVAHFTFLDVDGIAKALGLDSNTKNQAVVIEQFRDDDIALKSKGKRKDGSTQQSLYTFPIPRTLSSLKDGTHAPPFTHLIYAGTWFTLSLCGAALTMARFKGGRRSFRKM